MATTTSTEQFVDQRDDEHPIRWEAAGDPETRQYLSLEDAVRRIARVTVNPDAEAIQASLLAGNLERTPFAFYQYEDPS
jgi:hypothetical protein